jgi:hypothetical protein
MADWRWPAVRAGAGEGKGMTGLPFERSRIKELFCMRQASE